MAERKRAKVEAIHPAGPDHRVLTLAGGPAGLYRREPCADCPWRVDATGVFPADAFLRSAGTAHDMSMHKFACHASGTEKPATCAGFLLRGSAHNLAVRLARMRGEIGNDVTDGGHALHACYRVMAVANGCDPAARELGPCRDDQ